MDNIINKIRAGILVMASALLLYSCGKDRGAGGTDKRLNIVTTTGMIQDAVVNLVGDKADVSALMAPEWIHLYKATQGDLKKLNNADVIIYNGLHLEGKMGEVFEKMSENKPVIPYSEGLPADRLRKSAEFGDAFDPHIWFDVSLWAKGLDYLADTLGKLNPGNAAAWSANASRYRASLDSLHQWVLTEVATVPEDKRVLITAHDAFGYFGRAYDIEVKGLQGISTVSEFGLKDVTNLVNFIVERQIKALFVETSVSPRSITAVMEGCKGNGHEVKIGGSLFSDAMGASGTPEGTYSGMVRANVKTIVDNLK